MKIISREYDFISREYDFISREYDFIYKNVNLTIEIVTINGYKIFFSTYLKDICNRMILTWYKEKGEYYVDLFSMSPYTSNARHQINMKEYTELLNLLRSNLPPETLPEEFYRRRTIINSIMELEI